jgi:hypothetical protein
MKILLFTLALLWTGCGDSDAGSQRTRSAVASESADPVVTSRDMEAELDTVERELSGDSAASRGPAR